jgi:hypothetical protein
MDMLDSAKINLFANVYFLGMLLTAFALERNQVADAMLAYLSWL